MERQGRAEEIEGRVGAIAPRKRKRRVASQSKRFATFQYTESGEAFGVPGSASLSTARWLQLRRERGAVENHRRRGVRAPGESRVGCGQVAGHNGPIIEVRGS